MIKILPLLLLLTAIPLQVFADTPVLLFSDMTNGQTDGWEGSASKGAAVTVWGFNFGSSRGDSYVTVGGETLTSADDYAEWGATTTPYVARGLQRITFFLNSSMSSGSTTIVVTTDDGDSESIPFYTRTTGDIYFASPSGSDSNGGTSTSDMWQSVDKARANLDAGDVCYFRTGTYSVSDISNIIVKFSNNHNNGTANNSITYAAYPGEAPMWGGSSTYRYGIVVQGTDEQFDYHTFSKISIAAGQAGDGAAVTWATNYPTQQAIYIRFIGCDMTTLQDSKTILGTNGNNDSHHFYFFGNYIHDAGKDTRESASGANKAYGLYLGGYGQSEYYYIGYNEISWNDNTQGKGIQIYGHNGVGASGGADEIDYVYIYGNWIHDNNANAMVLGGGDAGGGDYTDYGFIDNIYVYNNLITNNGTTGIDIGGPSVHTAGDGGNFYIYNNTIYESGGEALNISPYTDLGVLTNNIIYGDTYFDRSGTSSYMSGELNIFYGGTDYSSWDTDRITDDPLFTNASSDDYTIQASSPAIGVGAVLSTVFTDDYDTRARGSLWDIGAYEYAAETSTPTHTGISLN